MRNMLLLLLGAILIGILSYFCFMDKADTIKDDLISKAKSAYTGKQMNFVDANLKGEGLELTNTLTLTGTAPSVELKQEAERVALSIAGISGVDNQLKIATVTTAPKVAEVIKAPVVVAPVPKVITPPEKKVVVPSPYTLTATKDNQNTVVLNGYTPDENTHKEIVHLANTLFGSTNVVDNLKKIKGAPDKFILNAKLGLNKLNDLDYGELKISDTNFNFRGYVDKADKKELILESLKNSLSNNYIGKFDIKTPKVAIKSKPKTLPAPTPKTAAISCQNEFKNLLSKDKIHFETAKAEIKSISHKLLDNLYDISKKCPKAIISIEGHTDSIGSKVNNQALSEKRAKAVKDYFIKKGMDSKKLISMGHGETKPIGDNFVKKGRAENRRIEFIIKGVK